MKYLDFPIGNNKNSCCNLISFDLLSHFSLSSRSSHAIRLTPFNIYHITWYFIRYGLWIVKIVDITISFTSFSSISITKAIHKVYSIFFPSLFFFFFGEKNNMIINKNSIRFSVRFFFSPLFSLSFFFIEMQQ